MIFAFGLQVFEVPRKNQTTFDRGKQWSYGCGWLHFQFASVNDRQSFQTSFVQRVKRLGPFKSGLGRSNLESLPGVGINFLLKLSQI